MAGSCTARTTARTTYRRRLQRRSWNRPYGSCPRRIYCRRGSGDRSANLSDRTFPRCLAQHCVAKDYNVHPTVDTAAFRSEIAGHRMILGISGSAQAIGRESFSHNEEPNNLGSP